MHTIRHAFAALALLTLGLGARAVPLTYAFDLSITDGPLTGDTYSGTFSFDDSLVVPGGTILGTDFFGAFGFVYHGVSYTAANADLIELQWNALGELTDFVIGNLCVGAAGCDILPGVESWGMIPSAFAYAVAADPSATFLSEGPRFRLVGAPSPIPEPATLPLLAAAALLALMTQARQRA